LSKRFLNKIRKALKRIRIPIQREEIEEGAKIIKRLIELKSPFLVECYEGFWETPHGPYFTVTEYYPV
jgi:hypothetical protein